MDDVPQKELNDIDKKLGALFQLYMKKKGKKNKKLAPDETELMHFRIRYVSLCCYKYYLFYLYFSLTLISRWVQKRTNKFSQYVYNE